MHPSCLISQRQQFQACHLGPALILRWLSEQALQLVVDIQCPADHCQWNLWIQAAKARLVAVAVVHFRHVNQGAAVEVELGQSWTKDPNPFQCVPLSVHMA